MREVCGGKRKIRPENLFSFVIAQGQDHGCKDHFENKFKQVKNYSSYFSSKENK